MFWAPVGLRVGRRGSGVPSVMVSASLDPFPINFGVLTALRLPSPQDACVQTQVSDTDAIDGRGGCRKPHLLAFNQRELEFPSLKPPMGP